MNSCRGCTWRTRKRRLDGLRDRIHFFELRLDELPKLQLDKREVIEARLTSPVELQSMALTGLLASYLALRQPPDG